MISSSLYIFLLLCYKFFSFIYFLFSSSFRICFCFKRPVRLFVIEIISFLSSYVNFSFFQNIINHKSNSHIFSFWINVSSSISMFSFNKFMLLISCTKTVISFIFQGSFVSYFSVVYSLIT